MSHVQRSQEVLNTTLAAISKELLALRAEMDADSSTAPPATIIPAPAAGVTAALKPAEAKQENKVAVSEAAPAGMYTPKTCLTVTIPLNSCHCPLHNLLHPCSFQTINRTYI